MRKSTKKDAFEGSNGSKLTNKGEVTAGGISSLPKNISTNKEEECWQR